MTRPSRTATRNILLRTMSADDYAHLQPHLEPVKLAKGDMLIAAGQPIAQVYFIEEGVGSTVAISPEGERVEVGLFGHDGVSALPLVLGADRTPNETFMQIEGSAQRLPAAAFGAALDQSPALRRLMLRYANAMSLQSAYTALSNALHDLPTRLARWILMCHDRVEGDELALTHEFVSIMLGVRRPGVTTALHLLEGRLLIRSTRGRIRVRDRAGLEAFAADAYGVPEAEYERLVAPMRKRGGSVVPGKFRADEPTGQAAVAPP